MRAQQHPLWQKLRKYDFGGTTAREEFTVRLARENGWSQIFADRVVEEYRKFMFLGTVGDAMVCPSHEVDQAWHLHLTYTREYWDRFCAQVLGAEFHHTPAGADPDERTKHRAMYEATLNSYAEWFGSRPPTDIWPNAEHRFDAKQPKSTIIDAHSPQSVRPWGLTIAGTLTIALAAMAGVHGGIGDPLDFAGPEFLKFFLICLPAAAAFGILVRIGMRPPGVDIGTPVPELTSYETAYLSGGTASVAWSTIAALVRRGVLHYKQGGLGLTCVGEHEPMDPIARQVATSVKAKRSRSKIVQELTPLTAPFRERLTELGLLMTVRDQRRARALAALPGLMLLALGLTKIGVGLWRGKPIEFLAILCFINLVIVIAFGFGISERSARGSRALEHLQYAGRSTKHQAFADGNSYGHDGLVTAYGLFGAAALYHTPAWELHSYLPHDTNGTGDGGSSGGGGGDGGGGCGGGGCGGCGGGD